MHVLIFYTQLLRLNHNFCTKMYLGYRIFDNAYAQACRRKRLLYNRLNEPLYKSFIFDMSFLHEVEAKTMLYIEFNLRVKTLKLYIYIKN